MTLRQVCSNQRLDSINRQLLGVRSVQSVERGGIRNFVLMLWLEFLVQFGVSHQTTPLSECPGRYLHDPIRLARIGEQRWWAKKSRDAQQPHPPRADGGKDRKHGAQAVVSMGHAASSVVNRISFTIRARRMGSCAVSKRGVFSHPSDSPSARGGWGLKDVGNDKQWGICDVVAS